MTDFLTEDEIIAAITWLTRPRLHAFVSAALVIPLQTDAGAMYRPVDFARLELLADLTEEFDLPEETLAIVMALIDELHTARFRLMRLAEALEAEPLEIRHRIGSRILTTG